MPRYIVSILVVSFLVFQMCDVCTGTHRKCSLRSKGGQGGSQCALSLAAGAAVEVLGLRRLRLQLLQLILSGALEETHLKVKYVN